MDSYFNDQESHFDYVRKTLDSMYNHIIFFILLIFFLIVPFSMAYVGVKNLDNCPKQPNISVYLFVAGVTGIIKVLQALWSLWKLKLKERFDQEDLGDIEFDSTDGKTGGILNPTNNSKFVDIILSIFLIVWFGIGQYWVFSIWKPSFEQSKDYDSYNWCSKDVYMFAIYSFIVFYSMSISFLLIVLLLFMYSKFCKKSDESNELNDF